MPNHSLKSRRKGSSSHRASGLRRLSPSAMRAFTECAVVTGTFKRIAKLLERPEPRSETVRYLRRPMARILTGIQSTGIPHLGNVLGAIRPAIAMANDPKNESFLFIADLHSLTQ